MDVMYWANDADVYMYVVHQQVSIGIAPGGHDIGNEDVPLKLL